MERTAPHPRTFQMPAFPKRTFMDQFALAFLCWVALVFIVTAITVAMAIWEDEGVTSSHWGPSATQMSRWYIVFIGGHLGYSLLPIFVSHGLTRRAFGRQFILLIAAFSAAIAGLVTLGFLIEGAIYQVADWPQTLDDSHFYNSVSDLHFIFLENWMVLGVWASLGAFVGVSFYRDDTTGMGAILLAFLLAAVTLGSYGADWGPFRLVEGWVPGIGEMNVVAATVINLGTTALALALLMRTIIDANLRPRPS